MDNSIERKNNFNSAERIITLIPIVISTGIAILLIIFYVIPQYFYSNKVNLELNSLIKKKSFYTSDLRFEPLHWMSAVDIDNYDDFEIAKMCFELQKKLKKNTKK